MVVVSVRPHTVSPYRYALDQANAALTAALSRTPSAPESSVTMSRNAKGDIQWEIVVRGEDVFRCEQDARELNDRLQRAYPHSSIMDDLKPMLQATVAEQEAAADKNKTAAKAAAIARRMK